MTKYVDKMILLKYNELNKPDESITNTVRFKKKDIIMSFVHLNQRFFYV